MAFSSKQTIFKVLFKDDDFDTTVDRTIYYELVKYALKKYCSFDLTEKNISQTVEKHTEDQPIDIEIIDMPITSKHQLKESISIFLAKATSFISKDKQKQVLYADMIK
ncbi:hypothetical protein GLOIN_2v1791639 [Rhizophagus irregularis DAOM 181602=DAOM 197198]|uniref:Uncharacterized protein n=1 Tax=Rhizophagus irregularis (strain DAOM 181602 / DAOM 197198 / MUCL 43194) TaxID=747089 RepID=A0A2P4NWT3_RHIID|nr:hypothetical protein GLOIN_2v1791639 [Rhizophagus irregularis DAOM 181602=DAOM 197198]POG57573.1 hypothetical protein GLOIN_2v1791639 [Rhizophagus irregularis DAOM 181602=DAOM 197198]GET62622.1 hypothetical protein GLOIN_2v1791639 [Rhizophagus irregularis DAOM 181602=DAOM 197198]|eukprot:XP_025164439.1 hypothetical protein GLOIN_2v1791639 [Rhizophagus irregularis DAOM 181602=DAOM 197198]